MHPVALFDCTDHAAGWFNHRMQPKPQQRSSPLQADPDQQKCPAKSALLPADCSAPTEGGEENTLPVAELSVHPLQPGGLIHRMQTGTFQLRSDLRQAEPGQQPPTLTALRPYSGDRQIEEFPPARHIGLAIKNDFGPRTRTQRVGDPENPENQVLLTGKSAGSAVNQRKSKYGYTNKTGAGRASTRRRTYRGRQLTRTRT
jgi:hypothetical protein